MKSPYVEMKFFNKHGEEIPRNELGKVKFEIDVYDEESDDLVLKWKRLDNMTNLDLEILTERLRKYDDYHGLAIIGAWEDA